MQSPSAAPNAPKPRKHHRASESSERSVATSIRTDCTDERSRRAKIPRKHGTFVAMGVLCDRSSNAPDSRDFFNSLPSVGLGSKAGVARWLRGGERSSRGLH